MVRLVRENAPVTARQLFYLLVSEGVIQKNESEYKRTVIRLALDLRQSGGIDWSDIVDRTRWFFKPNTYVSVEGAIRDVAKIYRRSLWTQAQEQVQVWCESMSVAGIIDDVTDKWDVPLFPGKGYSSHDFLRSAARDIARSGKPTRIYLLGDYGPSERDIIRFVEKMLRRYASEVDPSCDIEFTTLAVTEEQIEGWSLPSHPAKKTDSRHTRYGINHAAELEAVPPDKLRELVDAHIASHIDSDEHRRLLKVEAAERETLLEIAEGGWW